MIKKWLFPFPAANGKEITDPNAFYAALAGSEDGFFPIGANGLWHGGVHFGAGTSGALKQDDGIRCIADGEVVAYRLDQRYPEIQYPSGGGKAAYSTGFVLVRHKLVLPPPPSPPGNASSEAAAPPPADDVLVFFSLYMHLLDKAGYDSAPHLKRPKYWGGPAVTYAVGAKAKDKEPALAPGKTGLRIRNAAHEAAGLLPTGAIIKLGAASAKRPAFNELASVVSGAEGGKVPDSTPIGYVFKAELDPIPEPDAAAVGAVYVLPTPIPVAAGALMGHMGNYQNFDDVYPIPARGPRPLVHLEVFTGADLPAFLARSRARAALLDQKQRNRLLIDVGAQVYEPIPATGSIPDGMQISASSDSPKSGRWAKAKLLVPTIVPRSGLGAYQASTKTYQYQGQRVIFTGRFVGAADNQVTTNEAEAKRLGYARREVMLPSGDAFWVQRSDLGSKAGVRQKWDKFPLQLSQPGSSTINTSRVLTKADLEKIPAIDRALDANGRQWWKLNRVGWICERDQAKVVWKSPWDWAGFELVEETSRPADLMARDVHHLGGATGTEASNFKQRADNVDGGPLLSKVRQAIDKQGVADGVLTRQEFKRALSLPWLADRIGRLIVRYESEWGGDMGKWDELDALMMEGLNDWDVEKSRIKNLQFIDAVGPRYGLSSKSLFHIHPVALTANFRTGLTITIDMLRKIFPGGGREFLGVIADDINQNFEIYRLDTKLRLAHFFAQIREEAGSSCTVEENFNYSSSGLIGTFGYFDKNPAEAELYGRTSEHAANPQEIANRAYANRIGNGDVASGDGWKYRGRGLKQLTGRGNYSSFNDRYKSIWPGENIDFVSQPDLLLHARYALRSAVFFWLEHGLFKIADKGDAEEHVDAITAVINLKTKSYSNRRAHFSTILKNGVFNEI